MLRDAAGKPFLIVGDAAWSLIAQLDRDSADFYLRDRRARGFNTVLVNILEHKFASHAPANFYGDAPFTTPNDFATPNETYFAHVDWVLNRAAALDLLVLAAPAYLGWDGDDEGWYQPMRANKPEALRSYGRFIGARYAHLNNVIWVEGGDYDPPDRDVVRAVANGIRETAPAHLHTVHCTLDSSGLDYWPNEEWLSLNTVYTRGDVPAACAREYERPERLPFFYMEGGYENEDHDDAPITEQGLRRQAYEGVLSGGCGHVFGNNPIWHFDAPGIFDAHMSWREALSSPGAQSMTHLRNLFSVVDWPQLVPDFARDFVRLNGASGDAAPVAALAADASFGLAYVSELAPVRVDLTKLKKPRARLRWFDPANGSWRRAAHTPFAGDVVVTPPGENSAGFKDWLLLIVGVD